ncbi:hypothetical protein [Actinoplanes sp. TFC3]|uniref:hypothetical protein n=1 Tax=Actinoplanes sp. TFC3 TaxID=1710355 RepID=UPI001F22D7A8|nr:hypothetical protein [Actinoplanes sp. TFC3]
MEAKLPGFESSVGTAEQPAPKFVMVSEAPELAGADIIGAADEVIGAAGAELSVESESLPHAASEKENKAAAATAVICLVRILNPSVVITYPHN